MVKKSNNSHELTSTALTSRFTGMVALGFGTGILAIWTCVWLNASDASGDNYQGPGSVYVYAKPLL